MTKADQNKIGLRLVHTQDQPVSIERQSQNEAGKKQKIPENVRFDRHELSILLNMYGRQVAKGEWRDYAIDMLLDRAVFSIFKRTSERPVFQIEKDPKLRKKQGMYRVVGPAGQVLKRGHDLAQVLRVLDANVVVMR